MGLLSEDHVSGREARIRAERAPAELDQRERAELQQPHVEEHPASSAVCPREPHVVTKLWRGHRHATESAIYVVRVASISNTRPLRIDHRGAYPHRVDWHAEETDTALHVSLE